MRTLLIKICLRCAPVCVLAFIPQSLQSQPLVQSSVRADAMGGAFLAVSNDASALQFSPAGLLNNKETWFVDASHHLLFAGIDGLGMTQLGLARNISSRRAARQVLVPRFVDANAMVLAAPAAAEDTLLQRWSLGAQLQMQNFPGYNQNAARATLAYGMFPRMNDKHMMKYDAGTRQAPFAVSVGMSARYLWVGLNRGYLEDAEAVNEPGELVEIKNFLANDKSTTADWAMDAGVTYYHNRNLQAAFSVINLKQPNLAAKLAEGGKSKDGLFARRYRAGVAYRMFTRLLAAVDVEKNSQARGWYEDYNVYVGAEYDIASYLAARGGFNRNWLALGASYTFLEHFRLHGAWQHDLHSVNFNNLRFAFSFIR